MNELLSKIKAYASDPDTMHDMRDEGTRHPGFNAVLPMEEIRKAEAELGFKFPELLVQVYTEIGNGGFGPGYGLYEFAEAKKLYLALMAEKDSGWEKGTFPMCTWGCGIDSYVDCMTDGYIVYYTNENFAHSCEDNPITFTMTDKDGNVISSGSGGSIMDVLNGLDNKNAPKREVEEENDEPGLTYHKDTLEEWFTDWADDVDLWGEMSGESDDEEEEDDEPHFDDARHH